MPSTDNPTTPTSAGRVRRAPRAETGDEHLFRGAIQGDQARRLHARVQQRNWQRQPGPASQKRNREAPVDVAQTCAPSGHSQSSPES